MTLEDLINCFKFLLSHIFDSLRLYGDLHNIDVEIMYLSNDYIIVNKPEDVFTNNHGKDVSNEPSINWDK